MATVTWLVGGPSKNVDAYIAHLPAVKAVLNAEAKAGGSRAKAKLAAHHHGATPRHSKITVTKGTRLDWFINLDDADGGAAAIEFGSRGFPGVGALTAAFG